MTYDLGANMTEQDYKAGIWTKVTAEFLFMLNNLINCTFTTAVLKFFTPHLLTYVRAMFVKRGYTVDVLKPKTSGIFTPEVYYVITTLSYKTENLIANT